MLMVITGPRVKITKTQVHTVLDAVFPDPPAITLISGRAKGADQFGELWAQARGAGLIRVPIDHAYDGHDPYAAPKNRNQRMVDMKPRLCVGFPGHNGTNDMLARCHKAGMTVWEVEFDDAGNYSVWQWPNRDEPKARLIAAGSLQPTETTP
ncbi:GTP-binding domain [Caulobacter phage CcrBL9]|uniref:YspA cpYpsA-related SLOG domain-containing protein n=1 Tax=Caulobacter phage CcrBL9 TaxID=2283270 RepID=A0A385EEL0_9CAUD|nr:GTP-binding domain [Caulobacter phage CcrBL9]AXQ69247.1 hypothetical protein CcrBL9_gp223 [Caulobacter phage CcrBL9]